MISASANPRRFDPGWVRPRRGALHRRRSRPNAFRPALDALEERVTPSAILVTNALDPIGRLVPGSLRWAVAMANISREQDPVVEITPAVQGTIVLHAGELRISHSLTIENESGGPVTIQQAKPNSRVIHVLANSRTTYLTIAGASASACLTLTGGHVANGNGGGILVENPGAALTLQYANVVGNVAAQVTNLTRGAKGNGGGVYTAGSVSLQHSSVSNNSAIGLNSASGHAGGIYTDRGITLVGSHVDGNSARNGGGILNVFGSVVLSAGSSVSNNVSNGHSWKQGDVGGGGVSEMNGNVIISHSQVNNNKTSGFYSGGIEVLLGGVTLTDGSQVNRNTCNGPGGGIAVNFGGAILVDSHSQVDSNTSGGVGGGVVDWSENYGIQVTDFGEVNRNVTTNAEDATSAAWQGPLFTDRSITAGFVGGGRGDTQLTAALELFVNACGQRLGVINQARAALPSSGNVEIGAGVCGVYGGPIEIFANGVVDGNHFATVPWSHLPANGLGGGVFSNVAPITIRDSDISDNSASGNGGGVWNGLSLYLYRNTVTGNKAGGVGGGVYVKGTWIQIANLFSGNRPDNWFRQT